MTDELREPMDRLFSDVDHLAELVKDFHSEHIDTGFFVRTADAVSVLTRSRETGNPHRAVREFEGRFEEKRNEFKNSLLEFRDAPDDARRSGGAIRSLSALSVMTAEVDVFEGSIKGFRRDLRKYLQMFTRPSETSGSGAVDSVAPKPSEFGSGDEETAGVMSALHLKQSLTPLSSWASGVIDWLRDKLLPEIKRIAATLWHLISRFLNLKEWSISGSLGVGILGFVQGNVGLQITFGP